MMYRWIVRGEQVKWPVFSLYSTYCSAPGFQMWCCALLLAAVSSDVLIISLYLGVIGESRYYSHIQIRENLPAVT